MVRLLPCVMPDLVRERVLVLEFRKLIGFGHIGQPVTLERVADFSEKEAEGKTVWELIEIAEKEQRFKNCPNDILEVLISDTLEFKNV